MRHLGYACINMTLSDSFEDSDGKLIKVAKKNQVLTSRTCRLKNFSLERVNNLILKNTQDLLTILKWNEQNNIKLFRLSSDMFPFMDHPDLNYSLDDLPDKKSIVNNLHEAGCFAINHNMRLTSHPGQYVCLASPNSFTVEKSIASIEMHAYLGELLGLDDFIINVHIGGNYGLDYINTAKRFCSSFNKLSPNAQQWLTVENDDKRNGWNVDMLYNLIYKKINTPIIFDFHHWKFCNNGEEMQTALNLALSTWGDKIPKCHYSESSELKPNTPAHSQFLYYKIPDLGDYDVMLEVKQKEKALIKYIEKLKKGELKCWNY
jgi:UV DNA damage endonuclease